jgi:hypothetical protein
MLCLDDCFATTTMPQPTEITQFIFGQPLKHPEKVGRVTVAGKPRDDVAPGTLNSILKQAGLKE